MQFSASLWGGAQNPIIPVFRSTPREWRNTFGKSPKPEEIAKAYIRFYEPDVFVEAQDGLGKRAGLEVPDTFYRDERFIKLKDVFKTQNSGDWDEPSTGLGVVSALHELYERDEPYQLRQERQGLLVKPQSGSVLAEAMFGVYPSGKRVQYISDFFRQMFSAPLHGCDVAAWREAFERGKSTPLAVTNVGLTFSQAWYDRPVVFIFDHTNLCDLIDLWNMRLQPSQVIPVPITWLPELSETVARWMTDAYLPLVGNNHGVMDHWSIVFGQSLTNEVNWEAAQLVTDKAKKGSVHVGHAVRVWEVFHDRRSRSPSRMKVTAEDQAIELEVDSNHRETRFSPLSPSFVERFAGHGFRWANVVQFYGSRANDVTALPFNNFDLTWPIRNMVEDRVQIGSEGWVYGRNTKEYTQTLHLPTPEEAIFSWLKLLGIKAALSEPGHIAKQILERVGSIWGMGLLADEGTLALLNRMAPTVRRRVSQANNGEVLEEVYEGRFVPLQDWDRVLKKHRHQDRFPNYVLKDFTDKNIVRMGLTTHCPTCMHENWLSLTSVNYTVECDRCLNSFDFPQHPGRSRWTFRTIGPFAVQDYARGGYGSLLTLRFLMRHFGAMDHWAFATASTLTLPDGAKAEADFLAWYSVGDFDSRREPRTLIGEAKSFGKGDLIKANDIAKLKLVASKIPGSIIVVSVLKTEFTPEETGRLIGLVRWGRRNSWQGKPINQVFTLTGIEIFEGDLSFLERDHGKNFAPYSDRNHRYDIDSLAEASQAVHLGMQSYEDDLRDKYQPHQPRS
jgi:hypothetical protein